jgi:hypothetical protein
VLLVFSQPGCGACHAIRADLQHWHRRLGERLIVAVVEHAREAGPADYPVLLDQAGDVAAAYGIDATPSAVLIGANGRLASGVARGAGEIEELQAEDPASQEHRLRAVASEERLADLEDARAVTRKWTRPEQEPASALAPDQVAGVVAGDRRCGGQRDHELDLQSVLAGQHCCGDQRGLARERDAA